MTPADIDEYVRAYQQPGAVMSACNDYRAGAQDPNGLGPGAVLGRAVKLDGDVADVVEEGMDHGRTEVRRLGDIDGSRSNRGPHRK
jgi:hypothetical protein